MQDWAVGKSVNLARFEMSDIRRGSRSDRVRRSVNQPVHKASYINGVDEDDFMYAEDYAAGIILDSVAQAVREADKEARAWLTSYFEDLTDDSWEDEDEDDRESPSELADMIIDSLDEIMPGIIQERLFS